ncbi:MAG: hypothetical protein J6A77_11385 [Lachnospiraceae bacterium]|nr:hypothetical protein [Lachnospiraceae bacterium]
MRDMIYWLLLMAAFSYAFCAGNDSTGSGNEMQECLEKIEELALGLQIEDVPVTEVLCEFPVEYSDGFWVDEEENIYVLATYEKCIWEYKAGETRQIPLEAAVLPADVVAAGGLLYVYDDLLSEVQIYTKEGELKCRSNINLQEDYVKQLVMESGTAAVITYGGRRICINPENGEQTVLLQETVRKAEKSGYDYVEFLAADNTGKEYFVCTSLLKEGTLLAGELVLHAVSPKGTQLGSYVLPVEEFDYLAGTYLQIQEDGRIYLMVTGEKTLEIRKIELGREAVSNLPEIIQAAEKLEQENQEELEYRRVRGFDCTRTVELDREEVWERVLAMAEYEWTLRKTNTETTRMTEIEFPREIEALRQAGEKEEDWSAEIKGLPYCWGGFCSIYGGESGITFDKALEQGYLTGNSLTEGYYKTATIGVDCSGLLTAALGFDEKLGTKDLLEIGTVLENPEELEVMDYLVSPGNHVMVFCGWLDAATMLVCESAVREGKVSIHPKTIHELAVNGSYIPCSFWQE